MSKEHADLFKFLEEDVADIYVPPQPEDHMEQYILKSIDPLTGAQMIQQYVESQSPDMHDELIRKYLDILNFHFMTDYMNCPTQVSVEGEFGRPEYGPFIDMVDLLVELEDRGGARVGGKMYYFEKHYYTDEETKIRRPIVSLRMHSGAFIQEGSDGSKTVPIHNYVTIPVTSISDYSIRERAPE